MINLLNSFKPRVEENGGLFQSLNPFSSIGENITSSRALAHTCVFACNKILSESIASLPLVLYKKDGKNKEKAKEHPLYNILKHPNSENTSLEWREMMITSLNLKGNHYTQIIRDGKNNILELMPLDTDRMSIKRLEKSKELVYIYKYDDVNEYPLKFEEVLHVKGLSLDGVYGLSPITYNKEAISLSCAVEKFGSKYFANGATPSGALSVAGTLSEDAFKRLKEQFEESYTGLISAHKPLILEGGSTFEKISMSNEDSQFLDTRKYQKTDIASIFRVPPHMIGDLERATFSNIEQMSLEFVIYSLLPWLTRIEQAMQRDLLSVADRADGYFIKHNLSALLRGDQASRSELYKNYIQNGIFSINDVLELEDRNPTDLGDKRYFPLNFATLEDIHNGTNLKNKEVKNES